MCNTRYCIAKKFTDDGLTPYNLPILHIHNLIAQFAHVLRYELHDLNSPYKTEYLLSLKLHAAEELKKGNKTMKDIFSTDMDH